MSETLDKVKEMGFPMFQARPWPAEVIVYRMEHSSVLEKLFPGNDLSPQDTNGRCSWLKQDGYNVVLIGIDHLHSDAHAVIAHECYHAMNVIYSWFGAWHEVENDEPGAYLLADLYRQVLEPLDTYQLTEKAP